MRFQRPLRVLDVLGFQVLLVTLLSVTGSATLVISPGEENFLIRNDFFYYTSAKMAVGNFDGKGGDDVALFIPRSASEGEVIVVLNPAPGQDLFSNASTLRITVTSAGILKMADLNGDGRMDLVIGTPPLTTPWHGQVDIVFGQETPLPTLDLVTGTPDLRVIGTDDGVVGSGLGQSLAAGDFLGDEVDDLFVGVPGSNGGFFLKGGKDLARGSLDLANPGPLPWVTGPGLGYEIQKGNFNGGKEDLVLSKPTAGEVNIFYGRTTFPDLWAVGTLPPDIRMMGQPTGSGYSGITAVGSGDLNRDGKDELLYGAYGPNLTPASQVGVIYAIDGADIAAGVLPFSFSTGTVVNHQLSPLSLNFTTLVPVDGILLDDFDGDGAVDFFYPGPFFTNISGILSSEVGSTLESFEYKGAENQSFRWEGTRLAAGIGHFGSDGPRDLVDYVSTPYGPPHGALRFVSGFQPLKNPSVHIRERSPTGTRVTLELYVDGNPTEVYLTGNLAEDFRNRWVPYQDLLPVDLSSTEGDKIVRVIFRNATDRQSGEVSDSVTLAVDQPGTETRTNLLRPGGQVRIDIHLKESGHVKAEVFSREGVSIARILEEEDGAGVWPVVWDGKNAAGQPVSPGLYVIVITVNGHVENHKIIVQG